ncbi:MAG: peroxiredoxin [Planctomycetota bacterium]
MSMVGKKAPEWSSTAYCNGEKKTIGSQDYIGQWHVIYWYPFDFTSVCLTEVQGFQDLQDEFHNEGVAVIGASTGSFFAHKNWFEDGETFKGDISHPVIADTNHQITKAFDVFHEGLGVGYRATVIVDPQGVIRSQTVNDLSVGRSPAEILRTVQGFISGGACAANWSKGDEFVS